MAAACNAGNRGKCSTSVPDMNTVVAADHLGQGTTSIAKEALLLLLPPGGYAAFTAGRWPFDSLPTTLSFSILYYSLLFYYSTLSMLSCSHNSAHVHCAHMHTAVAVAVAADIHPDVGALLLITAIAAHLSSHLFALLIVSAYLSE